MFHIFKKDGYIEFKEGTKLQVLSVTADHNGIFVNTACRKWKTNILIQKKSFDKIRMCDSEVTSDK